MPETAEFFRMLQDTQRATGEVAQSVAALQVHMSVAVSGLEELKRTLAEDRERSRISRANISDSIDEIEKRLAHVEDGLRDLATTKETVEALERKGWRREAVIGGSAAGLTGIIAFALYAKDTLAKFFGLGG